jgi:prepilin-type N-terminal cleavage/methylation domain-containing protein
MKHSTAGFTLAELVVTITILGIVAMLAIPSYNTVINSSQKQANKSSMEIIKSTFVRYHLDNHMHGDAHFPELPDNNLLDSTYSNTILQRDFDKRKPNNLFSGDLPQNSNNVPYSYYWEYDTTFSGRIETIIIIKDEDVDSPSYNEKSIGEI